MSSLKARFTETQARTLLESHFEEIGALVALRGGESSQAFAFTAREAALILRVSHHAGYAADDWAWRVTAGRGIPVPRVLATGREGLYHWAVSDRAPGRMINDLPRAEARALIPALATILLHIHETPVDDTTGYGLAIGGHRYPTWRAYMEDHGTYGDFIDWPRALASANAGERALIEGCWARGRALLRYCPETRVLTHGDYNLANVIADGGRITGVVDWASARYGDPLHDVASIDFWAPDLGFVTAYLAERPLHNAHQRLACYQLLLGAFALGFFLHTGQPHLGAAFRRRVEALLRDAPE